jgi:hypothetical protein
VRILATSRQYLVVPARLLDARPLADPVDLAITPGLAAEPAAWVPLAWIKNPAGTVLGPGILAGPGGHLTLPPGQSVLWVREHLADGTAPAWPWTRLSTGLAG